MQLLLNDRTLAPRAAQLELVIATQAWSDAEAAWLYGDDCLHAAWRLEVDVDEFSGDDSAAAPSLYFMLDDAARLPRISAWNGLRFDDPHDRCCEAWYGNDAPPLTGNVLEFGAWDASGALQLRWSARFHDWETGSKDAPFLLAGGVAFAGITMQVKQDADAARFLALLLPAIDASELQLAWGPWIGHAAPMPPDRRRWHPATWTRKPLP